MKKKMPLKCIALSTLLGIVVTGGTAVTPGNLAFAQDEDISSTSDALPDENFEISDIIFSPEEAAPGDTVTVRALTNGSRHHVFSVRLEIPVNNDKKEHIYLMHGENDILEGHFTIGDNWQNGTHSVDSISVTASDQSVSEYDVALPAIGSFTVSNSGEDFDPPEVHAVYFSKTEAFIGDIITINTDITHQDDLEELIITLSNEEGETHSISFEDGQTGMDKDTSEWSDGTYRVTTIFVRDKSGNREYYEEDDNLDEVSLQELVLSRVLPDTSGPVVSSVMFDPVNASPDSIVSVTAEAYDPSGVSFIKVEFADSKGNAKECALFDNGEALNGEININNSFLNGDYTITHITATDNLGNVSEYIPGHDTPELTVNKFSVSKSLEDNEAPFPSYVSIDGTILRPGETSEIRFTLSDKSDIWSAGINIYRENTNELLDSFPAQLENDGSYVCKVPIDNQWFNGYYDIRISAQDALGNNANIPTGLQFFVYDSAEDYEAPELVSITADKTDVVPGDVVTLTAEISEASNVDYVLCSFLYDDKYVTDTYGDEELFTFSKDTDGLYKAYIHVTERWKNGEHVLLVHTNDEWDNYEDDIETGIVLNVTGSEEDLEGPEVTEALFDRSEAHPGDMFYISAKAYDPSGIDHITLYIQPSLDDFDGSFNPHTILRLYPDEEGNLIAEDLVDNAWTNSRYTIIHIEATDLLGNKSVYDTDTLGELHESGDMKLNSIIITGSTKKDTKLHVSKLTFAKEKVNVGDTMTVTAKVEGEGEVKELQIQIADDNYNQMNWHKSVEIFPDENGNLVGTFRIDPADNYWRNGFSYGISAIHLLDTDNNARYYAANSDTEVMEDLRNVVTNRFTVDIYSEPIIHPADYGEVDAAIEKVPKELGLYNEEGIAALRSALEAVVRGKTEREQLIVNSYAAAILNAINALEFKDADYGEVDKALASVPKDLSVYTKKSVADLQKTIDDVVRDKNITEQPVVDEYAKSIFAAIEALEEKPAETEPPTEPVEEPTEPTEEPVTEPEDPKPTEEPVTEPTKPGTEPVEEPTEPKKEPVKSQVKIAEKKTVPAKTQSPTPVVMAVAEAPKPVKAAAATGDKSHTLAWVIAASASAVTITGAVLLRRRRKG